MDEPDIIVTYINGPIYLDPFSHIVAFSFGGRKLEIPGGVIVNVYDAAVAAGIPVADKITLTVTVSGDVTALRHLPGLDWGVGWHPDSTFKLINKAKISGFGGDGAGSVLGPATPGTNAIELRGATVKIDNAEGNIWAGGGGGGWADGGNVGGGGGAPLGRGGGGSPTNGTTTGPGPGGDDGEGNFGGSGGDFGEPGQSGSGVDTSAGGAAGKAINLEGGAVIWISGNDPERVKGLVT